MTLPIDTVLPELLQALQTRNAVVLQAPPGAGKTTRVPPALLDQPWLQGRRILMLEPRRLAARSAARFMAAQLGEAVGGRVGYRMRLDTRTSRDTRIEVVTEGVLTRLLQDDPALEAYGIVIFDEFHERNLQADLGLALALESRDALRDDLRLLVMSATLDGAPIARLLDNAPIVSSEGRSFPVEVRYLPAARRKLEQHVAAVTRQALDEEAGSILVFLPGAGEIRQVQRLLEPHLPEDVMLAPLFGDLAQKEQDAAIAPAPAGRRKVVLATAIAETSLTIEGVRVVIDAGLERRPRFDPGSGLTRLLTSRASRAASEQRRGRAGRLEPGICYRLWAESEQDRLAAFSPPEILEADLSGLVLELAQWGARTPDDLAWLDPPSPPAWAQAQELLQRLGALDADGAITDHGRAMLLLGLPPRLAHMGIMARRLGLTRVAAELAALLTERDILSDGSCSSDIELRLAALRGEPTTAEVNRGRLQRVRDAARLLRDRMNGGRESHETTDSAGLLLAFAFPDRIARRRHGSEPRFLLANGRGARLDHRDNLRSADWLVATTLDGDRREARVFLAAEVSLDTLHEHFGAEMREAPVIEWDNEAQAVMARLQRRLGALVVTDGPLPSPPADRVTALLLDAIRNKGVDCLPWNRETRQWQARVEFMRRLEPDRWPEVTDQALSDRLEEWAAPFLEGYNRISHLEKFPLREALGALLGYPLQHELDAQAPVRIEVPSGARIGLDYTSGSQPVLAVRLQELFGLADTPRIARGRVPVMLHLLSPASRPVQVTQDLAGFWRNTYHDVRKDLRGRYPKHQWPDDPLNAEPPKARRRSG